MGDPRRLKKKYSGPQHPWEATRIEQEKKLIEAYGLKNKKEIWKSSSFLRKIKSQVKTLIASTTEQAKKEEKQLLKKLQKLNLLDANAKIEDVLNLKIENILDRRLQSQVYKRGLARTPKQARQFVTHGHIQILDHEVNIPSYLVEMEEEAKIIFSPTSELKNEDHPERVVEKKEKSKE
ncbi:MAG: 30S ribosomal protein S4, partial [Nanoarchaeota archaeon]